MRQLLVTGDFKALASRIKALAKVFPKKAELATAAVASAKKLGALRQEIEKLTKKVGEAAAPMTPEERVAQARTAMQAWAVEAQKDPSQVTAALEKLNKMKQAFAKD